MMITTGLLGQKAWKLLLRLRLRPYQALIFFNESWNHDQGWEAKKLCQFLLRLEVNDWMQHKRLEEVQSLQKIGSSRKITEIGRSTKIGKIGFTSVLQSDFFTNSVKPVLLHI